MPRELFLLRHAKSAWPEGVADYNRPLKKRGKKAALLLGEWLLSQDLSPDWIVSSHADRARETAEKLCKGLQTKKHGLLYFDDRIYEASVESLKSVLADCPSFKQRVLIVGHNPGLDNLLIDLVAESLIPDDDDKILGTANLARIILPDDWNQLNTGCGQLISITKPKDILTAVEPVSEAITEQQIEIEAKVEQTSVEQPVKKQKLSRLQRLSQWLIRDKNSHKHKLNP
jgi:phosphohistidine phosphatase